MDPPPPTPPPRLVRFVEPTEGAYSLTLPEGWSAQGGVARGAADPRPWYRVVSPGGGAELRGSDPRVPPNFVAAPPGFMPMPGAVHRPYIPPEAFAEEYARHFARELGAMTFGVSSVRDVAALLADDPRPETPRKIQTLLANGAAIGGVVFDCPDRALRGLVDVVTLRMHGYAGPVWSPIVTALAAPVAQWPHAKATLVAIAQSYATNPAWQEMVSRGMQMQHQATMDSLDAGARILRMQAQSGMEAIQAHAQRARIAAQSAAEVDAMGQRGWSDRQASSDEAQRRVVNSIREEVDLYDPAAGEVLRGAPAGFATWWSDGAGTVVASEGHDNPDPSRFTQAVNLDDIPAPRGRQPR